MLSSGNTNAFRTPFCNKTRTPRDRGVWFRQEIPRPTTTTHPISALTSPCRNKERVSRAVLVRVPDSLVSLRQNATPHVRPPESANPPQSSPGTGAMTRPNPRWKKSPTRDMSYSPNRHVVSIIIASGSAPCSRGCGPGEMQGVCGTRVSPAMYASRTGDRVQKRVGVSRIVAAMVKDVGKRGGGGGKEGDRGR